MPRASNPNLKKPNEQTSYTPEQVHELKRCMQDPIYFISTYIKVQHPVDGAITFEAREYAQKMIQTFYDHRKSIILAPRQIGKTATVGAYLLWFAIFHFDKTVLIASNKNANAMEIIDRIQYAYENLPLWLKPGVTEDGWNKHSIGFDNKSRIVSCATSATSGRGMSISLLFVDEFAFVAPSVQEEFWKSMSPTLATGGACIIASTPNGDQNKFAQLWRTSEMGLGEYAPITVRWDEPPNRDEQFKEDIISTEGTLHWLQEYECKFLSSDALLIDSMVLSQLGEYVERIEPISTNNEFDFYKELKPDTTYIVACDPATGSGDDFSVIEVFDFPQLNQVAEFRSKITSMPELYTKFNWLLHTLKNVSPESKEDDEKGNLVYYSVENNGIGQGLITLIERSLDGYYLKNGERGLDSPCFEFISDNPKKYGVVTTPKNKIRSCINLKELTERGKIGINSKVLMKELKTYVKRANTYQAQRGSTDDAVSATLIILRILEEISDFEEAAFEKLYSYDSNDYYRYDAGDDEGGSDDGEPLPIIM